MIVELKLISWNPLLELGWDNLYSSSYLFYRQHKACNIKHIVGFG